MNILLPITVFLPFAFAPLTYFTGKKSEKAANALSVFSAALVFILSVASVFLCENDAVIRLGAVGISFTLDGFREIYILVITFMWLGAALLSPQYFKAHRNPCRFYFFLFATLGATLGVFLSADLYTTFLFFELMSLTSYCWVVEEETKDALSAGKTYLTIAVSGGLVTLMGMFMLYSTAGTLTYAELSGALENADKSNLFITAILLFFGFAAKAGIVPLHIWLPKAHPVAPAPASALLSGVLTKAGIFGAVIITTEIMAGVTAWGYMLLILGAATMLLGALLALFGTNLKYILACSSLSQIGFITVGISMMSLLGEENALAANGVVLYMLNHSLVKLVLFLSAGVVYMNAHTLELNELKGFGRNKPILLAAFLVGGMSLAGIPSTLGYAAKTLIHEAIVEYAHHGGAFITFIEWLFLISGGITLSYVLKIFIKLFVEKPDREFNKKGYMTLSSALSVMITPIFLLCLGIFPNAIADKVADMAASFTHRGELHHQVEYFSLVNLKGIAISAVIGTLIYFLIVRMLLTREGNYRTVGGKLSLEDTVYVPFFKALGTLIAVCCKLICDLPGLIFLGIKTVFLRTDREPDEKRYVFLKRLGNLWDELNHAENPTTATKLISAYETIFDTTDRIVSNLSFALIMACFGICAILIVMFIV
ncbi:MAG: sodium:proton antiporter [Clostridia bacterium]|nr:sodium:proton antiporter [Clostridia bacterium]